MNNADKIRTALADPAAPWYGSDLVPLVDDYVNDAEELLSIVAELARVKRAGVGKDLRERAAAAVRKAKVPA